MTLPKRVAIFASFIFLLLGSGAALYWLMFRDEPMVGEHYDLVVDETDQVTGFKERKQKPTNPKLTDLDPDTTDSTLTHILKGYFHQLDLEMKKISVKHQLFGSSQLEVLSADYSNLSHFYCWPEEVDGGEGLVKTSSLEFFVGEKKKDIVTPVRRELILICCLIFYRLTHL